MVEVCLHHNEVRHYVCNKFSSQFVNKQVCLKFMNTSLLGRNNQPSNVKINFVCILGKYNIETRFALGEYMFGFTVNDLNLFSMTVGFTLSPEALKQDNLKTESEMLYEDCVREEINN